MAPGVTLQEGEVGEGSLLQSRLSKTLTTAAKSHRPWQPEAVSVIVAHLQLDKMPNQVCLVTIPFFSLWFLWQNIRNFVWKTLFGG